MMHAQIIDGTVGVIAPAPTQPGYGPDGHWHDHFDVPLEDLELIPADYDKDEVPTDG